MSTTNDLAPTESFPANRLSLKELLEIPEFENLTEPFERYLKTLAEAGLPNEEIAIVIESVTYYLEYLNNSNLRDYAYFLLPSTIDPYSEIAPNDPENLTLIARWETEHGVESKVDIERFGDEIINYEPGNPAKLFVADGSMFSAKTLRKLKTARYVMDRTPRSNRRPTKAYIAEAMGEERIFAREGGRGDGDLVQVVFSAPATPLSYTGLIDALSALPDEIPQGSLVLIDEISFFAFTSSQNSLLIDKLLELASKGIFIFVSGLDSDYRGVTLNFFDSLNGTKSPELERVRCSAFYAYRDYDHNIHTGNGKTYTFRIDGNAGFADFLLPVPIGREYKLENGEPFCSYLPIPEEAHPFLVLKKHYPDVYAKLMNVSESAQLFDYYKDRMTKAAKES